MRREFQAHTGKAMAEVESWIRKLTGRGIMRRATLTSLLVGSILTIVNHGSEFTRGGIQSAHFLPIAFTYLVPFVVSVASSVSATRTTGAATNPDAAEPAHLRAGSAAAECDRTTTGEQHGDEPPKTPKP
jgi:hypothetical protein